jgi:hypothetical protein
MNRGYSMRSRYTWLTPACSRGGRNDYEPPRLKRHVSQIGNDRGCRIEIGVNLTWVSEL